MNNFVQLNTSPKHKGLRFKVLAHLLHIFIQVNCIYWSCVFWPDTYELFLLLIKRLNKHYIQ